jgi:hypothetical protein
MDSTTKTLIIRKELPRAALFESSLIRSTAVRVFGITGARSEKLGSPLKNSHGFDETNYDEYTLMSSCIKLKESFRKMSNSSPKATASAKGTPWKKDEDSRLIAAVKAGRVSLPTMCVFHI